MVPAERVVIVSAQLLLACSVGCRPPLVCRQIHAGGEGDYSTLHANMIMQMLAGRQVIVLQCILEGGP